MASASVRPDTSVPDYERYDFTTTTTDQWHQCDLVMKGGITSGVVYPPALLRLATRYRFRAIGGTSAGAIAAVAAAAAEYGRENGGFNRLATLQGWLAEGRHLRDLFQPSAETRPLLETLLEVAGEKRDRPEEGERRCTRLRDRLWFALPLRARQGLRLHHALLRHDPLAVGAGAVLGARLPILGPLVFGWLGGVGAGLGHLAWILAKRVPTEDSFFGMCIGRQEPPAGREIDCDRPIALTDWLSLKINDLAGLELEGDPLTFRDLATKPPVEGLDAAITLQMVATNLNQGEPYVFPRPEGAKRLVFREAEMHRFFPGNVVDYMKRQRGREDQWPEGYYYLPVGDALPVVVAARMSLSLPVLLSAVPLYDLDGQGALQKHWFSDGGICSNFPIHFFDWWLPPWPTFGINLTSLRAKGRDSAGNGERVFLPRADAQQEPERGDVQGLVGFAAALFRSAQNFRDNTQARLPSYRERIVQVRFDNEREGGLNLAMSPETIAGIIKMGDVAAVKLLPAGEPGQEFNFSHHRWVRLQVLMSELETQIEALRATLGSDTIDKLMQEQLACGDFPYVKKQDWCDEAQDRLAALRTLIEAWAQADQQYRTEHPDWPGPHFFEPLPDAEPLVLRVTPKL